jgi:hypothetical protein
MAFDSNIKGYMTFGKSFSRGGAFPLEAYEIWTDYDALVAYAANTNPDKDPSYIGQKVAYVDKANNKVTHYGIEIDGTLKELGASPIGDEKSIVIGDNNTISLKGIAGLVFERDIIGEDGEPTGQKENVQFQPLMTKDGLIWVEPSKTTVEGLAALIDGLTARVSVLENDRVTEQELADAVKAEADRAKEAEKALDDAIKAIDFVDGDELAEAIKDFATDKEVEDAVATEKDRAEKAEAKALADAKTYTNEEISGLTVAIEQKEGIEYIVVKNKAGTEVASVDASKFVQDSFLNDVAYDAETGKITFTWTMGDGSTKTDEVAVADFVQTYTAGTGLKLEGNQFSVDTDVIATTEALNAVRDIADAAQTAEEVSSAITTALGDYYTAEEIDGKGYAVASEVETAIAGVQEDVDNLSSELGQYYLSKSEAEGTYATKTALADLDEEVGLLSADLATLDENIHKELSDHETAADAKYATKEYVGTFTTGEDNYKDITTVVGYINKKAEETLSAVQGDSTETVASVKLQLDNYKTENDAKVQKNTNDIAALVGQLATTNTNVTSNTTAIGAINTTITTDLTPRIAALEGADEVIEEKVAEHTEAIKTINETTIPALQGVVNTKAAQSDVDAINAKIGTVTEGKTVVDMINAVAGTIDFTPYATNARVDAIYKAGEGDAAATGLLADTIVDVAANTAAITALVGSDANKSARSIAAEEINRLIKASDDEGGETIENIGNLVDYVEKNAGEIAALVTQANKSTAALAGIGGEGQPATVIAAIQAAAYVLPGATAATLGGVKSAADVEGAVAVNKVYVDAETNIGEVKAFSTDNLVQGKFTLVLNGGDAEVTE